MYETSTNTTNFMTPDPAVTSTADYARVMSPSYDNAAYAGIGAAFWIVYGAILVLAIVCFWRIFSKAGKPGWAALVPFYNIYVFFQIVGRPGWWLLLLFVPFVSIIINIVMSVDLAKSFGKGAGYGIVLLWLFPIGFLHLAFSSAKYVGPGAKK